MIENYMGYKNGKVQLPLIVKYRPKTFEDFEGNDSVIQELKNILPKKPTHAFLLSGPIGCGKTSLARIIAKELGCKDHGYNLIEVNSADVTGIDDMRKLLYWANLAKLRTFIFDEAHKISEAAQNAALKGFEEAPSSSYFIICTDKPNKIIPALRSRCFVFELSPLLQSDMLKLLRRVCKGEGWELSEEILNGVVKESEGVPREALKKLIKAYYDPNHYITVDDSNRVFVLQDKSDLECFRYITHNIYDYSSVSINTPRIERYMGKNVIIIQIKSEAGRNSTETFLRKIGNIPKSIKTIEMPGEENKSFEDWINTQSENMTITTLIQRLEDIVENPPELKFPSLRTAPDQLIISFDTFTVLARHTKEHINIFEYCRIVAVYKNTKIAL